MLILNDVQKLYNIPRHWFRFRQAEKEVGDSNSQNKIPVWK